MDEVNQHWEGVCVLAFDFDRQYGNKSSMKLNVNYLSDQFNPDSEALYLAIATKVTRTSSHQP